MILFVLKSLEILDLEIVINSLILCFDNFFNFMYSIIDLPTKPLPPNTNNFFFGSYLLNKYYFNYLFSNKIYNFFVNIVYAISG